MAATIKIFLLSGKCMGTLSYGSAIYSFIKGNYFCDFLFPSLDDEALPKLGLLLKERSFSFFLNPFYEAEIIRASDKREY